MATPPSPRSQSRTWPSSEESPGTAINNKTNSPRPSPALSAYSYTSSVSSGSDFDLNALSLDDWGIPSHKRNAPPPPSSSDRSLKTYLQHTDSAQSGAATPVAGSGSSSKDFDHLLLQARSMNRSSSSASTHTPGTEAEQIDDLLDDEDDAVENEPDGFDVEDEDEEDMHANGVPAARGLRLNPRQAKTPAFHSQVLSMLSKTLEIDSWSKETVDARLLPLKAENVQLKRISGAFSNAVFFVSYRIDNDKVNPTEGPKTLLLRVYGSGTEVLLSRRAELLILHTLSSLYEIGPHILGTFANGRVETFFDAEPIGKEGIRDLGDRCETIMEDGSLLVRGTEGRAQWVARRMRQLHEVPLETMRTVLEQGDLRSNSDGGSMFGRGIENHLFARSHRPRAHRSSSSVPPPPMLLDGARPIRESPGPMATEDTDTSLFALGAEAAHSKAMAIRGYSPHRNDSVASFDSLATSYNSQDGSSIASMSNENLLMSPNIGPSHSAASSYADSISAARFPRGTSAVSGSSPYFPNHRPSQPSKLSGTGSTASQPYPGMWRRSKRWAREAGKVLALVDEFCKTTEGQRACARALKGTQLEGKPFSPFNVFEAPRIHSLKLGTTVSSLRKTLLAIAAIDFPRFLAEMDAFKKFIRKWERANGSSRRVLAHGDTQYSNLLLIKEGALEEDMAGKGMPRGKSQSREISRTSSDDAVPLISTSKREATSDDAGPKRQRSRGRRIAPYERLIVIDFEYCSPNPRAYDIANAFHEWRFDYHNPTDCWSPYLLSYPTREERRRWLRAYVEQGRLLRMRGKAPKAALDSPVGQVAGTPPPTQHLSTPPALPSEELKLPPAVLSAGGSGEDAAPTPTKTSHTSLDHKPLSGQNGSSSRPSSRGGSASSATTALAGMPSPSMGGVEASPMLSGRSSLAYLEASIDREIERLEREVEIFSPACHASWALWGMTFAKEGIETLVRAVLDGEVEGDVVDGEHIAGSAESFDNLRYALSRVELFREEITSLGISVSAS